MGSFQKLLQFLWLLIISLAIFPFVLCLTARCSSKDRSALLQFNQSLMIKTLHPHLPPPLACPTCAIPYAKTQSWKEDQDCCSWAGITCDNSTGHVIELDISNSLLQGVIHPNSSIFHLDHLKKLNLALNNFETSQISSFFDHFPHLTHLNLSGSGFFGQIPNEISFMSKLILLDLSMNIQVSLELVNFKMLLQNASQLEEVYLDFVNMSSSMITESLTKNLSSDSLTSLSLRGCQLYGEFPRNIFLLPKIRMLELRNNPNLNGSLPSSPERHNYSSLEYLNLFYTRFAGTLPDSISYLYSLKQLDLSSCLFSGHVPESIGNLSRITRINLSNNGFNGQLPSTLAQLEQLIHFYLDSNDFQGPIPNVFANLQKLFSVSFANSNVQGSFPSSILNLTRIYSINFSENQLNGAIPSKAGDRPNLTFLYLNGNLLNGTIPPWIFRLPSLMFLKLDSNQFIGQIQEFHHKSIEVISLGYNQLHGPIPSSIFQLVNLTILGLESCQLEGVLELGKFSNLQNLVNLGLANNNLSLNNIEISSINFTLPNLQTLDLSKNQIHGKIPSSLWGFGPDKLTHLILSHNYISEIQLPWTNLRHFDISFNLLRGSIPIPPTTINDLFLSSNVISGEIPFLLCNSSSLTILDLSNNHLTGELPKCLGNMSIKLSVLDVRRNHLTGNIPEMFDENSSLRSLNLNQNKFQGSVPHSLLNCTRLEVIDLGNNNLSGTFPYWLDNLPMLQVLILRSNGFFGTLESSETKFPFPLLRILDLANNNFSGLLPDFYIKHLAGMMNTESSSDLRDPYIGQTYYIDSIILILKRQTLEVVKILNIFTVIDLSMNKFQGKIPDSLGNLHALQGLNLSSNFLEEEIPTSIADLRKLEFLDLSSNNLKGQIPQQLTRLNFLAVLNLSNNHLAGSIPRGRQFDTFGNDSYVGNSELCGFPLTRKCGNDNEKEEPRVENQESEKEFDWRSVVIGYASGLIIGLIVAQLIFWCGKPKWFNEIVHHWCKRVARHQRKFRIVRMYR